jgi:hypothetical protein
MMSSQLFFPQVRVPNRREVTDAILKVYPDAKVLNYKLGSQNVGQPLIQVPSKQSKNYLLNNKTIGEEADIIDEGILDGIRDNLNKRRIERETAKRKERIENSRKSKETQPKEPEEPKYKPCPWENSEDNKTVTKLRNDDKLFDKKRNSLREEGPSLSVGRGEKLPVSRGGGLTQKGRDRYNRETGSNLKAPVTGDVKPGSEAAKRRKNFCSRSRSWDGERGRAARRRWKC